MGGNKSNILKEIEELKSDWKAVGDRFDSMLAIANRLVLNSDELDESDIDDLRHVLAVTDNLNKMMDRMYNESAQFRAAFVAKDLVKSSANNKEGSLKKPEGIEGCL